MSLTYDIACQSGNASDEQQEARVETTATGVRWTITGKLCDAITADFAQLTSELDETLRHRDEKIARALNKADVEAEAAGDALNRVDEATEIMRGFLSCPEIHDCAPDDLDNETRELERRARKFIAA